MFRGPKERIVNSGEMHMSEIIVGIDLGTTNSEIAAFVDGKPQVIGNGTSMMLPSCVGLSPTGDLLIGQAARNQMMLYPERTVRSVKRLMGSSQSVSMGDKTFSPSEISALILRELAGWAQKRLGAPISKAVITVPAYFSDAQRNATREAGQLAGLEVVRIVNEPTAASLAYGLDSGAAGRTVMIYDLGGGTLDVSIVRIDGDVTEVLSSHGNNQLGGDDFDQKLTDHLLDAFRQEHNIDLRDKHPAAYARLWWAAEAAKKQLSFEPYTRVVEEALIQVDGRPLHLDVEISRDQYEQMIRPLLDQTLDSASKALTDAGLLPQALDSILLVGGSTRTPLVLSLLEQMCGKAPRQDLHPDLCVALGAGVLASRLAGHDVQRVLVDVSPYSFGPSYTGERDGQWYHHCYHPIIRRNTPLPVTRTDEYHTASDFQTCVELEIYQGDDPDALRNIHIGKFKIEGLTPIEGPNAVLCRMRLDLDGILHVTAIEKGTGLSKHVAITGATRANESTDISHGRDKLNRLFANRLREDEQHIVPSVPVAEAAEVDDFGSLRGAAAIGEAMPGDTVDDHDHSAPQASSGDATALEPAIEARVETSAALEVTASAAPSDPAAQVARCRQLIDTMHPDDQEEAIGLMEEVETALTAKDTAALAAASKALGEFLFFVEGR
jgi:molecular chaperone DnaK (HSP70)